MKRKINVQKMRDNYIEMSDFSLEVYRKNRDLTTFSDEALIDHYLKHGIQEGRIYNHITNRKSFIQQIIQIGKMLEIGPLDRPQLDHTSPSYHSLDVFTKKELVEFYNDDPDVNIENIIEPTYIITNNDYSVIQGKFSCIFSSHNIEHMPCLVTFLRNLENLLAEDGLIYFVIPDKRYCFDYFKNESNIYDVLGLYYEKNARPRFIDVLKMRTLNTHNNSMNHWSGEHGENLYKERLLKNYAGILNEYNSGKYLDAHVSFFTPFSFLDIMEQLRELGLIGLEVKKLYHTIRDSNEFYVVVGKA